jgi:hypothetical protein
MGFGYCILSLIAVNSTLQACSMKKPFLSALLVTCIVLLTSPLCFSQIAVPDTLKQQPAYANAVKLYNAGLGNQSPLYTGPEYNFYSPLIKGSAYFLETNVFANGSVFYDDVQYTNVPLLYDLYTDKLVAQLYDHFSKYVLIKYRVKTFDIDNHHFVNIIVDSTTAKKPGLKSGYYEELYSGKTQALVKRSKPIQTVTGDLLGSGSYFNARVDYFLKKDGAYYVVSGEGSMLDVLKDHKKELQQYIKSNKLKFRKDPEDFMVKIATYYDHLTN